MRVRRPIVQFIMRSIGFSGDGVSDTARHVSGAPVRPPGAVRRRLASGLQPKLPGDAGQQPGGPGCGAGAVVGRRRRGQHGPSTATSSCRRCGVLGGGNVVHGASAASDVLIRTQHVSQTAAELPPTPTAATTGKSISHFQISFNYV